MNGVLFVSGVDVSSLGWVVQSPGDWLSSPARERGVFSPASATRSYPAPFGATPPRRLPLELYRRGTVETRVDALVELRNLFPLGIDVPIRFGADPRILTGRRERDVVQLVAWHYGRLRARVDLVCYDPCRYDLEDTVVALSTTPASVPTGDLPSDWIVALPGAFTTREIIVEPLGGGDALFTFPVAHEVDSGDTLEVDFERHRIVLEDALEVRTLANGALVPGTGFFAPLGGSGSVQVRLSAGTGSLTHRRKWQ